MKRIEQLRQEALTSCNFRNHKMSQFAYYRYGIDKDRIRGLAVCKVCFHTVSVLTHPMPNEISVGGEAVALDCKKIMSECPVCCNKRYLICRRAADNQLAVERCDECTADLTAFTDEHAAQLAIKDGIRCEITYPYYLIEEE